MTISTFPSDRRISYSPMLQAPRFQIEGKSDDIDLTSALRLLRRRLTLVFATVTLLMVPATVFISTMKPTYYAQSRVMIHSPLVTALGPEDPGGSDAMNLASETERLLSRSVSERVIQDLRLDTRPEFNPSLRDVSLLTKARQGLRDLMAREQSSSVRVQDPMEPVIQAYFQALRVSGEGPGGVIQIGFTAGDSELAAAVPNRLISIYLKQREESARGRLGGAEEWVRQRIAHQKQRLTDARNAVDQYRRLNGTYADSDVQNERHKFIEELGNRRLDIDRRRGEINATVSTLEATADISLLSRSTSLSETISAKAIEVRTKQQDVDRLLQAFGAQSDAVVDAQSQLEELRVNLQAEVHRFLQSLHKQLTTLDRNEAALQLELAAAQEQRARSTHVQSVLMRLERAAEKEQLTLDKLEEQRRALAVQATLPGAEVELLSPATVPLAPQGRGRLFYLVGALLASLSAAVTVAFLLELLDKSVRSFDQLAETAHVRPAGFTPHLQDNGRSHPTLSSEDPYEGMFNDAIRGVILALKQSHDRKFPASLVVTSAQTSEGKSLLARSLAIELVAAGVPTLLVDGDLSRGELDLFFGCKAYPGLCDFLTGRAGVQEIVQHHLATGVDVITAGNHRALIVGRRQNRCRDMAEVFELARSRGQVLIFDSAPVLASADTAYVAGLAERVLVVARWGKTSRRALSLSLMHLKNARDAEVSIVINDVKPERHALYSFSDSEMFTRSVMQYHTAH